MTKNQQGAPEAPPPAFIHYPPKKPELARVDFLPMATREERGNGWVTVALVEAQQPAPSAAAEWLEHAFREGWSACRDAEFVGEEAEDWAFGNSQANGRMIGIQQAAPQPSPTPQADIQPAPQGETNAQLDIDSNSSAPGQQRDVAGSVALGQPVGNRTDQAASHLGTQGNKLLTVAKRNIRSFLRSASFKSESDREAALNCVDVLWAAARAPADSVLEDAARYRFLAEHCRSTSEHWGGRWSIIINGPAPKSHDSEDDFDEAVDAARKQGANHD